MRTLQLTLAASFLTLLAASAAAPPSPNKVQVLGEHLAERGVVTAKGPRVTLVIGPADASTYRVMDRATMPRI
jgi:hypothetical protein